MKLFTQQHYINNLEWVPVSTVNFEYDDELIEFEQDEEGELLMSIVNHTLFILNGSKLFYYQNIGNLSAEIL